MNSIQIIVWTGGECTLLKEDLSAGIAYAHSKGINSRIVSNASWSKGFEKDRNYLLELKNRGLKEINISTGDMHQKFVSIEKVLSVVYAAISINLRTLIYIEKTKVSKFTNETLQKHPLYKKIKSIDSDNLFSIIIAPWVSINTGNVYEYDKQAFLEKSRGCNSLYNNITINPNGDLLSCCGLTVRYIPEMKLGNITDNNLEIEYKNQISDFMKQWLFVEGPVNILSQVVKWNKNISIPKFVHPCQACAYIFQNQEITETIEKNFYSIIPDITKKFKEKLNYDIIFDEKLKNNG